MSTRQRKKKRKAKKRAKSFILTANSSSVLLYSFLNHSIKILIKYLFVDLSYYEFVRIYKTGE